MTQDVISIAQQAALADGYAWDDLSPHDQYVYLDTAARVVKLKHERGMAANLLFLYVNLKEVADEHRLHDTEFALGRASMADEVADIIKLFMEEYDE